jgi:hypothetical protein
VAAFMDREGLEHWRTYRRRGRGRNAGNSGGGPSAGI